MCLFVIAHAQSAPLYESAAVQSHTQHDFTTSPFCLHWKYPLLLPLPFPLWFPFSAYVSVFSEIA